ncbi:hypothetical protein KY345_04700 [Candidatus Woesearchaeota archaeon]|nr:hypothetical protein [Candidatus Woesearchaeota archaeon]
MAAELSPTCVECPAEAKEHFDRGNEFYRKKQYGLAIREYDKAMRSGFHDPYDICQTIIDVGVNMGVLERKTHEGIPEFKRIDNVEIFRILKNAIEVSKQY